MSSYVGCIEVADIMLCAKVLYQMQPYFLREFL
jgi:hypothetical protein